MTLKECYATLKLPEGAPLDEVKSAYRKLAFSLHPDLNPNVPNAGKQFQQLNEAYVTLSTKLEQKRPMGERKTQSASSRAEDDSVKAKVWQEFTKAKAKADAARAKAQEEAKRAKERQAAKARAASQAEWNAEAGPKTREEAHRAYTKANTQRHETWENGYDDFGPEQQAHREEVLRDILNDDFARRVFSDIYNHIEREKLHAPSQPEASQTEEQPQQKQGRTTQPHNGHTRVQPAQAPRPGQRVRRVHADSGFLGKVSGWLRKQIDDQQTIRLPKEQLIPGAKVRLQIQHGLLGEVETVEVVLPPEFTPQKAIRLRGMGRRLGNWSGDLYVRIEPI